MRHCAAHPLPARMLGLALACTRPVCWCVAFLPPRPPARLAVLRPALAEQAPLHSCVASQHNVPVLITRVYEWNACMHEVIRAVGGGTCTSMHRAHRMRAVAVCPKQVMMRMFERVHTTTACGRPTRAPQNNTSTHRRQCRCRLSYICPWRSARQTPPTVTF